MQTERSILMLCTKFAAPGGDAWLTDSLAAALVEQGHRVTVLHVDWHQRATSGLMQDGRLTVARLRMRQLSSGAPRLLRLAAKYIATMCLPFAVPKAIRQQRFDLMIGFSPAIATDRLARHFGRRARSSCLIYWDFFPIHQQQIGVVPYGISGALAYRAEHRAVQRYAQVACMSPRNVEFFREYFPGYRGAVGELPVWGPSSLVERSARLQLRAAHGFAEHEIICAFGGQLIPGRDIERLCDLADRVGELLPQVRFVVAGSGPLAGMVEARAHASPTGNLRFLGQLSRGDYTDLLIASDIGLVFTASQVTVPTFPSKTVDYFRCGLPVLAAMERSTDYSAILQERIGAGLAGPADDIEQLIGHLRQLADDAAFREACGLRGIDYYKKHMTAEAVARQLLITTGLSA